MNQNINFSCPVCNRGTLELVLHRFWECPAAQLAWQWGVFVLNKIAADDGERGPWRPLNWKQGIFSARIPRRFDKVRKIWMAVRSTVVWLLWLERNDAVFNDIQWLRAKMIQKVWLGLINYWRAEWEREQGKNDQKFEK